ncbi:GNAT family N-acetyltransferase [Bacillus sp. 31A1R]|uniref:GNAT family N-acetyltransferase n=1 Tax=Robertmurraya mangrovi TaxID=3098077 RepID=A0ABU5IU45_9BACI|nr:GNAT family N-acetyltransferase [Bacillus sp. 31A1R]MDZ5470659.1 GNAT family N-acetyltransferase [Bacillus sp. 31A1R]
MEIKKLTEKDYLESMNLSMYAFQYEVPEADIPKRKETLKEHNVLCIWDDEQLAAKLHILPLSVYVQGQEWKMGGVAGVATYPEYRRRGFVKSLILESLKEMREAKQIISLLHPFDIGFYRKFGWEIMSDYKKSTIEKLDLKKVGEVSGVVKRFTKEKHTSQIEDIYKEFAKQYSGTLVRTTKWWLNHVYHNQQVAVYFNEQGHGKGYIVYSLKDNVMDIQEVVTLNHEAEKGLWNFICQHDSMVDKVNIITSIHTNFPYYLNQPKVKMEVYPYFMARIVDVERCLELFTFNSTDKDVFLHVDDSFSPWNNGTYQISSTGVKVFKNKPGSQCTNPPKVGIHLNINALTAILLGYKRPQELFYLEEISGRTEDIEALESLVPNQKSFFYDFF